MNALDAQLEADVELRENLSLSMHVEALKAPDSCFADPTTIKYNKTPAVVAQTVVCVHAGSTALLLQLLWST
jgi:hypothetical protein